MNKTHPVVAVVAVVQWGEKKRKEKNNAMVEVNKTTIRRTS